MKQTNLSNAGIIFGIFLIFGVWLRYFILYPDPDKALFFGIIGIIIIAVSWNYAGRIVLKKRIERLENVVTLVEDYIQENVAKKNKKSK